MSTGLGNYPNIEAPDSDYPDGNIKDKDISLPGTPVNKLVYADIHQTFAKWLRLADITPNGLPDNEYNGFQYIEAMKYLFGRFSKYYELDSIGAGILPDGDYNSTVIVKPTCGTGCFVTLGEPTGFYVGKQRIANYSANTVELFAFTGGVTINGGAPPYTLFAGEFMELEYNTGGTNWVVKTFNLLEP